MLSLVTGTRLLLPAWNFKITITFTTKTDHALPPRLLLPMTIRRRFYEQLSAQYDFDYERRESQISRNKDVWRNCSITKKAHEKNTLGKNVIFYTKKRPTTWQFRSISLLSIKTVWWNIFCCFSCLITVELKEDFYAICFYDNVTSVIFEEFLYVWCIFFYNCNFQQRRKIFSQRSCLLKHLRKKQWTQSLGNFSRLFLVLIILVNRVYFKVF